MTTKRKPAGKIVEQKPDEVVPMSKSDKSRAASLSRGDSDVASRAREKREFGRRVYSLMLARGLYKSELARIMGTSRDNVGRYANGETIPLDDNLERLAAALGVTPEELVPSRARERVEKINDMELQFDDAGCAWLRVSRLVTSGTALKVAELLQNDNLPDRD